MSTATQPITIEEYAQLPALERPTELVRGRIVDMNVPKPKHGYVCINIAAELRQHARQNDLGRVFGNDSGVITERDPDTLRGADVSYYSFDRLPRGPLPEGYFNVPPELVFEVRSPDDRWGEILQEVGEYLSAGVKVVCVVDPETDTAQVHRNDQPPVTAARDDTLDLDDAVPGFRPRLAEFLE